MIFSLHADNCQKEVMAIWGLISEDTINLTLGEYQDKVVATCFDYRQVIVL